MSRFIHLALQPVAFAALLLLPITARANDPTTADCLNAHNSSVELRNAQKLRGARAQLLICAAQSCPTEVRKECLRHADEVNAQIPTITFEPKDAAGHDLIAVKVTMDGEPLADRLEGMALSTDPGVHTFVFETEGQTPVEKQLVVREGVKDRRVSVVFGAALAAPIPPATQRIVGPVSVPAATDVGGRPVGSALGTQKIAALVAGGVGVVGLGLGTVFGLVAVSIKNDAQNACPGACASQDGVDKWSNAKTAAQLADVFFVVGGVGIAGAAALWFTAKPPATGEPATQVGFGPGGVQVRGTW